MEKTNLKSLIEEFSSRFEQLAGKTYHCKDRKEALDVIDDLIKKKAQGKVYSARALIDFVRSDWPNQFVSHPVGDLQTSAQILGPGEEDILETLKETDVGVTKADFAIAETGCLVEIAYDDFSRLLSSISRVHIAVLDARNVLPKLQDLAPKIRHLLLSGGKMPVDKPNITLISGPSRTSDIELKSVLGVHGPHEVHAVIIEDDNGI